MRFFFSKSRSLANVVHWSGQATDWAFQARIPAGAGDSSILRNVQTGSKGKVAGHEAGHSHPPSAEDKNECSYTSILPYTLAASTGKTITILPYLLYRCLNSDNYHLLQNPHQLILHNRLTISFNLVGTHVSSVAEIASLHYPKWMNCSLSDFSHYPILISLCTHILRQIK